MKTTVIAMFVGLLMIFAAVANAAPAAKADTGMTKVATCTDGKVYYHKTGERRGACSGHGGVATWADGTPGHAGKRTAYKFSKAAR
jgi:hypothetical protein